MFPLYCVCGVTGLVRQWLSVLGSRQCSRVLFLTVTVAVEDFFQSLVKVEITVVVKFGIRFPGPNVERPTVIDQFVVAEETTDGRDGDYQLLPVARAFAVGLQLEVVSKGLLELGHHSVQVHGSLLFVQADIQSHKFTPLQVLRESLRNVSPRKCLLK